MNPLAIDLYAGLGGWSESLIECGYYCVGFDIERHEYGEHRYPGQIVIQNVLTLHGSQFKNAALIVASPPCQEFSYMAMPWERGKQIARALRGEDEFPNGYKGSRSVNELTALFDACFRIQREACEAAGRHIPMVMENVRGAIPWVGRSRWNYGSFHLWGDVPALMPMTFNGHKVPSFRFDGSGKSFQSTSVEETGVKAAGMNWSDQTKRGQDFTRIAGEQAKHRTAPGNGTRFTSRDCGIEGIKQSGISGKRNNGKGDKWFQDGAAKHGSKSSARKAASAMIAKIPAPLAMHIARTFYPKETI